MAPVENGEDIAPLAFLRRKSVPIQDFQSPEERLRAREYTPNDIWDALTARDAATTPSRLPDHSGAVDPTSINMKGIQALFAIIGVAFALGSIWFFFWAKNGGFQWRKGDWDDYKSTVLRRKGPNGTTLSNATKSTKLGGGSIVEEGYSDRDGSTISGTVTGDYRTEYAETVTDLSSEAPIIKEKQQAKKSRRENAKDRKIREAGQADWEGGHDNDMRAYRHEKPARVGGINKDSEAQYYGTDYTETDGSVVHSQGHRSATNLNSRTSRSRQHSPEKRQPSRRDFSYGRDDAFSSTASSYQPEPQSRPEPAPAHEQPAPAPPPHRPGRYHTSQPQSTPRPTTHYASTTRQSTVPGAYQGSETSVSDVQNQNTKAYHHPLPTLNNQASRGFRRNRSDSLDD